MTNAGFLMRGILRLVAAHDGVVENRIRIQKEAFLLHIASDSDFVDSQFYYHHYGPYSRAVSDALQNVVAGGLLQERVEHFGEGLKYTYEITDAGRRALMGSPSVKLPREVKQAHWRALELAATALFIARTEQILPRVALDKAVNLKPMCAPFVGETEKVLAAVT